MTAADAAKAVPFPKVRMVSIPLTGAVLHPVPELQVLVPVVDVEVWVAPCASGLANMVAKSAVVKELRVGFIWIASWVFEL